jgi:hypothetical protein
MSSFTSISLAQRKMQAYSSKLMLHSLRLHEHHSFVPDFLWRSLSILSGFISSCSFYHIILPFLFFIFFFFSYPLLRLYFDQRSKLLPSHVGPNQDVYISHSCQIFTISVQNVNKLIWAKTSYTLRCTLTLRWGRAGCHVAGEEWKLVTKV